MATGTGTPRQRFAALVGREDGGICLAEGALLIAAEGCDDLDVGACLERLDALAAEAAPRVAQGQTPLERCARLLAYLSDDCGFVGNQSDYYDPRNSFLNEVLERRTGIPITLSIVYVEVARRIGLPLCGVSFPGHFLVRSVEEPGAILDPFYGRVLTLDDCEEKLREALGDEAELCAEHLRAARPREILARMLSNLKQVYLRREEHESALACADRLLLLLPDAPLELRDRGLIYAKLECFGPALRDLERFVELAGEQRVARALRATLDELRRRAAQIH
jgi:regulator of sirC expression with transglutaminase-like and TPR domain